jgi:serine/threonine-protein kinase RsbW
VTLDRNGAIKSYQKIILSQVSAVDILCRDIRAILEGEGLHDRCFSLELALREALNNAILHGNCGQISKRVKLTLRVGRRWIRISIEDEGAGFNWRKIRKLPIPDFEATSGRGLCILSSCSDRLVYNQRGNQVTFWIDKIPSRLEI